MLLSLCSLLAPASGRQSFAAILLVSLCSSNSHLWTYVDVVEFPHSASPMMASVEIVGCCNG